MTLSASSPEQAVELLDRAFNEGDLEAVLSFYETDAAVVTEPDKMVCGRSELRRFFADALRSGVSVKQLKTRIIETDGVALFLSRWTLTPNEPRADVPQRTFVATTVFRRQTDGSWRVLIDNPYGPLLLGSD